MMPAPGRAPLLRILLLAGLVWAAAGEIAVVRAQSAAPKAWRPSRTDSLVIWSTRSRQVLEQATGTELGAAEVQAFADLGQLGRLYFERLGPRGMRGAGGLVTMLDSLGHRAVVYSDPFLPAFTLVQYLHPLLDGGVSLCYLYWFRGSELLHQAINLHGGTDVEFRVYWLDLPRAPYEAAILFRAGAGAQEERRLFTMQLAGDASGWIPRPGGAEPRTLGRGGDARFVEWNGDRIPEIAVWSLGVPDSLFSLCAEPSCPRYLVERGYWRHEQKGVQLVSERPAPSALAALMHFLLALRDGREQEARSLVTEERLLEEARRAGLDRLRGRGAVRVAAGRCVECWPERIAFSVARPDGKRQALEAVFETDGAEWRLKSLEERGVATEGGAASSGASPPGGSR